MNELVQINNLIFQFRGQKVMLDSDLASLYGIETKVLNQAVKRNSERFPPDFMFQLTREEFEKMRSQIVTSSFGGGRQYLPYVFTEQGVAMLSGVLNSKKAIDVNIQIIRTFVRMRQWAIENKELAKKLMELEYGFARYCQHNDTEIQKINSAINLLMDRTKPSTIGF